MLGARCCCAVHVADHPDSPYIRALGMLYLRVGMTDGFKELWQW